MLTVEYMLNGHLLNERRRESDGDILKLCRGGMVRGQVEGRESRGTGVSLKSARLGL